VKSILIISDIHANKEALDAVLADAGPYDEVWCLGDLVDYGPNPNECIETVRELPGLVCLMGNHDAALLGRLDLSAFNREAFASVTWTKEIITPENLAFLDTLNERIELDQVTLSHGSPRNPIWEYLLDINTVQANFSFFSTPFCFVGHTHIPIHYVYNGNGHVDWYVPASKKNFVIDSRSILNPGSVGQPRDRDPRAAYAKYYPETNTWEPRRVEYNIKAVQKKILKAGLPQRHALRLEEGW
jgi:diadenosine tetraphosphatase ApaH/serine/threonine PP2A family protein phosphatase